MSESLIQMRFVRRHQSYVIGDVAAFPLAAARQLHALRVAEGLAEMVPIPVTSADKDEAPSAPLRQTASVVRK